MFGYSTLTEERSAIHPLSKAGVASLIYPTGTEVFPQGLAQELDPSALNFSVVPASEKADYMNGDIATFSDDYFFVLRWNPRFVRPRAANVAEAKLKSARPGQIILLCYEFGGWCVERLFSMDRAVARFRALAALETASPIPTTYLKQLPTDEDHIQAPFTRLALALWRQMVHQSCAQSRTSLFALANKRGILASTDDDKAELHLSYIGKDAPILRYYGNDWKAQALSTNADNLGAQNRHDDRTNKEYTLCALSGEPRLEFVSGHVELSNGLKAWVRYQRLILPVPSGGPVPAIQVFADMLPNLEFPFQAHS